MLWICICICPYHVTATLVSHLLKVVPNSSYMLRFELEHSVVVWLYRTIQVGSHINVKYI
jgi:hypothetical protein